MRIALPEGWVGGVPGPRLREILELSIRAGGGVSSDAARQALMFLRTAPERLLLFAIDTEAREAKYYANVNALDLAIPADVPVEEVLDRSADHYRSTGFTVHRATVAAIRATPVARIVMDVSFPIGAVRELVYLIPTDEGYRSLTFAELATGFNDRLDELEDAAQTFEWGT